MLRSNGYGVIEVGGRDENGKDIEVLLAVERRRRMPRLLRLVHGADPEAFWTLSDVKRKPDVVVSRMRRLLNPAEWRSAIKKK
jgi:hypothetical protein